MSKKHKKRSGPIIPGFVLCLSLGAMALLYFSLAPFSKPSLKTGEVFFEGVFFLLMLVCAFIILPQRRNLGVVSVGVVLLVFGKVLENIVRNAFEYTPQGRLEIAIHRPEFDDQVVFSVSDTGVGIAKRDLNRIFEPFYRGQSVRHDGSQGAGLGLSIAKKYIELMEGNVQVKSQWGVGTTFTVAVPRLIAMQEDASQSSTLPS